MRSSLFHMLALVVSSLASALPDEKNIHARALCRPRTVGGGGWVGGGGGGYYSFRISLYPSLTYRTVLNGRSTQHSQIKSLEACVCSAVA